MKKEYGFMEDDLFQLEDFTNQAIEVVLVDVRRVQPSKGRDLIWFDLDFNGNIIERCIRSVKDGEVLIDFRDRYLSLFRKLTLTSSIDNSIKKMIEQSIPFEVWINADAQVSNPQASKSDTAKAIYLQLARDHK